MENISLWEGVVCIGPERKYILLIIVKIFHFGRVFRPGSSFPVISLVEGVEVLEGKVHEIIGISWHLGLRCDLSLLSDVPLSVRMLWLLPVSVVPVTMPICHSFIPERK